MANTPIRKVTRSKPLIELEELALAALTDMKAVNVKVMDVRGLTDVADTMIIASGTSDRHVRSIAELVIERAKHAGFRPMGTEGKSDAEWVLVDLRDVLVHVMLPRVREFYALEQLWEAPAAARAAKPKAGKAKATRAKSAKPGAGSRRATARPAANKKPRRR
jgi:ribosome-associated protein